MTQKDIDTLSRNNLISMLIQLLDNENIAYERITDYGTLAIEVPYQDGDTTSYRWMQLRAIAPRDTSSEWLDQQIYAYEDRVRKDEERVAKKAANKKDTSK